MLIILFFVISIFLIISIHESNKESECKVSDWDIVGNDNDGWSICEPNVCGQPGKRQRTRRILKDGKNCPHLTETEDCMNAPCQVECEVSDWVIGDECIGECGSTGYRTRTREITNSHLVENDSLLNCPHLNDRIYGCSTAPCENQCELYEWENVGECIGNCGEIGRQTQIKRIKTHGSNCPDEQSSLRYRQALCEMEECLPPICEYDVTWTDITTCPPCGFGNIKKVRKFLKNSHINTDCQPYIEQEQQCQNILCEGEEEVFFMYVLQNNIKNFLHYYHNSTNHKFKFKSIDKSFTSPSLLIKNESANYLKIQPDYGMNEIIYKLTYSNETLTGIMEVNNNQIHENEIWYYTHINSHDGNNGYKLYLIINNIHKYLKVEFDPSKTGIEFPAINKSGNNFTTNIDDATIFYFSKDEPIDCIGYWSECKNGQQIYTLTQQGYFGGDTNCNSHNEIKQCEEETIYLKEGQYKLFVPFYANETDRQNDIILKLGSDGWDGQRSMSEFHWATKVYDIFVNEQFEFQFNGINYGREPIIFRWNNEKQYYESYFQNGSKNCYTLSKNLQNLIHNNRFENVYGRWWLSQGFDTPRYCSDRKRTWVHIIPINQYDNYVNNQPNKNSINF